MYKKVLAVAAIAALSTFGLAAPAANATHSWGGYHWARTSNPFTLKLGDNVTAAWDSYLATTSADWTASPILNTTIVPGSTTGTTCASKIGTVQVCNAAYGQVGWLGIASININGSHITQGTVKLNDTYFAMAQYNTPAWRNVVTCQEVGHTLGLAHQDENFTNPDLGTCMDYSNNALPNQHPNQHDYDMLASIYGHVDTTTTPRVAGFAKAHAGMRVGNIPSSWGHLIEGSRSHGHSTYVKHFGGGDKTVTEVIWVA